MVSATHIKSRAKHSLLYSFPFSPFTLIKYYGKQTPTDNIATDEDITSANPDDKASGAPYHAP